MFNIDFPSDVSSVKFRAVQWICTEVLLALAALLNFLPRMYKRLTFDLPRLTVFQLGISDMSSGGPLQS